METDFEVIESILNGNKKDFSILVRKYQKPMLRLILRMTRELSMAEDIVQEAFLKAYQNLKSFQGKSSFKSWIFQIGINTMKNKLRTQKFEHLPLESFEFAAEMAFEGGVEEKMMKADLKGMISAEIDKLPPRQRAAITLRIFDDLSFKEIAEIMECPYDTAKANFRHGFLKLKEEIIRISTLKNEELCGTEVKSIQDLDLMEVKL